MKRNMKLKVTALVAMLFMAIAVTFLSFSHADEDIQDDSLLTADATTAVDVGSKTNIDYIIANSNSTDPDVDPHYNIVEIYSDTASGLEKFADDLDFEKYVINRYSTLGEAMKGGMVNYKAYKTTSITNDSEAELIEISNADLIYVNQGTAPFKVGNDICENLYDILHTYAVGDYKPLIINSQSKSGSNSGGNTTKQETMSTLAVDVFSVSGKYYYTFAWDKSKQDVNQFLTHKNGSMYLGINGKTQETKKKWVTLINEEKDADNNVIKDADGNTNVLDTKKMAKFLIVSGTGTAAKEMQPALLPDTLVEFNVADYRASDSSDNYAVPSGSTVYDVKGTTGTIVTNSIYNAKYTTPDLIQVDQTTISDINAGTVNLGAYDFILIDETVGGATLTTDGYNALSGAMYASVSIVYSSELGTATTSSSSTSHVDTQAYNYLELYYMVATADNLARYDNIMVTSKKEIDTIIAGKETGAGAIASLINKSTYRGIGGKGSSSSMYTVLEIEPCYPIDVDLAESTRGGKQAGVYYTVPANVLNDVDKETLPRDEDGNIVVEYYDWELSKNKIADAIGIDPSQVKVVHMSTEELAASKEPLLGNYDLIYIGGNTSAFKADFDDYLNNDLTTYYAGLQKWQSIANVGGKGNNLGKIGVNTDGINHMPIYTMYSHNGDMVVIDSGPFASGTRGAGTPVPLVKVNGSYKETFGLLNGNDISYDRLLELEEYVKKGMPVIVEERAAVAYELVKDNGYVQNALDPDCNMCKFLKYCDENSYTTETGETNKKTKTVLWKVKNSSDDGLFSSDVSLKVNSLVKGSNTRPKLTVTSMPVIYNFYDKSTRLDSSELKFAFEVAGTSNYETNFYIDDDGNSLFTADEDMTGNADEVTKNSLKITLNNYFGPVYWKLEVKDKTSEITSYVTGLSYIKNPSGEKQTVRILQIMPGYSAEINGPNENQKQTAAQVKGKYTTSSPEGAQGEDTLFFCPICQRGFELYEYYPIANTKSRLSMWYYGTGAYYMSNTNPNESRRSMNPYLGKHEHVFGIPWYDSTLSVEGYTGVDDWSTNIADDISDLYDFDLDIMTRSDFEQKSVDVAAAYDFSTWTQAEKDDKINNFTIDATDPDYNEWIALTDEDAKLKFITKREYEDLANDEYQQYIDAKADADALIPAIETALETAINTNAGDYAGDLKVVQKNKRYADMFSAVDSNNSGTFRYTYKDNATLCDLADAYFDYRDKKDIEITHHQLYKDYMRYTYPDNWLAGSYDMIIIGAADNFALDDISNPIALADLVEYVKPVKEGGYEGNMLLFHGVLSPYVDSGSANFTAALRKYFGMDKNRGLTNDNPKEGEYYVNYSSSDSDRYFMTNLSYKPTTDAARFSTWSADIFEDLSFGGYAYSLRPSKYLTKVAYTDAVNLSFSNPGISQYKYAVSDYTTISQYSRSSNADYMTNLKAEKEGMNFGTDKASQNNVGIVTQYPFTLSDELNISPTHPQEYALELDNDNMTVWYSLAGGTNEAKQHGNNGYFSNSSLYAASRNDGGDNYFIYSFGNVNYCGAGHAKVTGVGVDNNDERRLYINIIVNSVRKSVKQPGITVYDYKTSNRKNKDGADYIMEVKNVDDWPEFSFSATVDTSSDASNSIARVRIYYDLDYLTATGNKDVYVNDKFHVLIADMSKDKDGNPLTSGTIYDVGKELAALQLKAEYFEPYNQEYTYIVIEVTDSNGQKAYQRIKIKLLPHLFEMTQNNINIFLDMIDKV